MHFYDIDFLSEFCSLVKISSGDLTHLELIKYAAKKFNKIILSTGLGTKEEVKKAVNSIIKVRPNITKENGLVLMHCVSAYPTPLDEANLENINWLKNEFNCLVGIF